MAEKRMFSLKIINSDAFLDLPLTAQGLYFHLAMRADDDGFIDNPKMILRTVRASNDDLNILIAESFLICFDDGLVVVRHWKIHNTIQKDRYKPTQHKKHKEFLTVEDNKEYAEKVNVSKMDTDCIQSVSKMETQIRLDKSRLDKSNKKKFYKEKVFSDSSAVASEKKAFKHKYGEFKNVFLSDEELSKLKERFPDDWQKWIEILSQGIEQHGYKYKNHYLAILKWEEKERKEQEQNGKSEGLNKTTKFENYGTTL